MSQARDFFNRVEASLPEEMFPQGHQDPSDPWDSLVSEASSDVDRLSQSSEGLLELDV